MFWVIYSYSFANSSSRSVTSSLWESCKLSISISNSSVDDATGLAIDNDDIDDVDIDDVDIDDVDIDDATASWIVFACPSGILRCLKSSIVNFGYKNI